MPEFVKAAFWTCAFSAAALASAAVLTVKPDKARFPSLAVLWLLWSGALCACTFFEAPVGLTGLLTVPLSLGIWALLRVPFFYALTAALLAGVLAANSQMLVLAGASPWAALVLLCLLAVLAWWRKWAILPDVSQPVLLERRQLVRGFGPSTAAALAALLLCLLWLYYLNASMPGLTPAGRTWHTGFTLAVTVLFLLFLTWSASYTVKRIEALVDKRYQAELLNLMQVVRSQRHDFNFHMQAISGMVENRQYEECGAYVRQMVATAAAVNDALPLQDPAVSAMLNSFQEAARQKGIRLELTICENLSHLPCTVYEINTIIGNLLQNAIDEVGQKDAAAKWAKLLILKRGGYHIIQVTNPCERGPETFQDVFQPGYSTKMSHEGIGLATVEKLVNRCGGTVYPELESGCVSFIVQIPVAH